MTVQGEEPAGTPPAGFRAPFAIVITDNPATLIPLVIRRDQFVETLNLLQEGADVDACVAD